MRLLSKAADRKVLCRDTPTLLDAATTTAEERLQLAGLQDSTKVQRQRSLAEPMSCELPHHQHSSRRTPDGSHGCARRA